MKFRLEFWLTGIFLLSGLSGLPMASLAQVQEVQDMTTEHSGAVQVGLATAEPSAPSGDSSARAHANKLPALLAGAQKVDTASLDAQRGGADSVLNDIHSSGAVTGNQAYNLSTGTNSIADGAFVGANGFSTVVQNSGNNVLIQNSTIINIQLQ